MFRICENIGLKSSNFWQTRIPEKFFDRTFGELYDEFCDKNLIILALYRLPGSTDNYSGYVFTKPSKNVIITQKDRVFVLGEKGKLEEYFKVETDKKKNEEEIMGSTGKDKRDENLENNDDEDEDEDNKKYSPFYYFKDRISEVEKEISRMNNAVMNAKSTIKESISSGVKQEIISLLQ